MEDSEQKRAGQAAAVNATPGQGSEQVAVAAPDEQGVPTGQIKVQNIRRGESLEETEATIIVAGTAGGKVEGRVVKVWRAQQATIKAAESILVAKEIIGSTESVVVEKSDTPSAATDENTTLTAPEVTIGIPGRHSSLAKELEITTGLLTMHQVSIHNSVFIHLAPDIYHRLKEIEGKPEHLKKKLRALDSVINDDFEDFCRRVERPGNEHIKPLLEEFVQAKKEFFENRVKVFTLLRKLVAELGLRTSGEILQRWRERIDLEKELRQTMEEIAALLQAISAIALNLSIVELRPEASLVIRFGEDEHTVQGPLAQMALQIKLSRVDGPEPGQEHIEFLVEQHPFLPQG